MKWAFRGSLKIIAVAALVTGVLVMTLGQGNGVKAAGSGVDIAGYSFGAAVGFIPRFFANFRTGQATASKDTPAKKTTAKS